MRAWALPPVIGAVIGYATNSIAIRMLFRPLEKKRLLGIPIPLTPGVIPRQRGHIARSIARVVSRELLTEDSIRSQLKRPEFIESLRSNLSSLIAKVLSTSVRRIATGLQHALPELERSLPSALHRLFGSREFIYALRGMVGRFVDIAGNQTLEQVVKDLTLTEFVQQRIIPRIADAEVSRQVARTFREIIEKPQSTIGDMLSPAAINKLAGMIPALMPLLMRQLIDWLGRPAMRRELETQGRILLRGVLDRLNILQKLFVGAAQYDRTLNERMPEIVDDALLQIERAADAPDVVMHLQEAFCESLGAARNRSLKELLPGPVPKMVEDLWSIIAQGPLSRLLDISLRRFLVDHAQTPVGDLMARYLKVSLTDTVDTVSERILRYLSDPGTAQSVADQLFGAVDRMEESGEITLAELISIDTETKGVIDDAIAVRIEQFLVDHIPEMIAALNVEQLVVDRIDALEVSDVERILLAIISRNLKWINLFGAAIGSLIGLTQLFLRNVSAGF